MATTVKETTLENICDVKKFFLLDLGALSEDAVQNSPGGSARKPIDYIFESAIVIDFICKRLKLEDLSNFWADYPRDENGFMVAPTGFTKEQATQQFTQSIDRLIELVESSSDEDMLKVVPTSSGEEPFFSLAMFAATHAMYHGAQLAVVQGLLGDPKNHWF